MNITTINLIGEWSNQKQIEQNDLKLKKDILVFRFTGDSSYSLFFEERKYQGNYELKMVGNNEIEIIMQGSPKNFTIWKTDSDNTILIIRNSPFIYTILEKQDSSTFINF